MSKNRINGEGNIRQRPDGRWEVRLSISQNFNNGKTKRISRYANTKEEAVKLLHQMSLLRDTAPNIFRGTTLEEWLNFCLEFYMKNNLKQSTYISYLGYIRNHLAPALGEIALIDLTPRLLQGFYNFKAEQGLSPKTIVNINLFLHHALQYAVNEGYIAGNPAEAINLPRGHRPQIEVLTREEQQQLMQFSYQHRYGVFIRLTLFTGLRLGELLGLRWEDVDLQIGLLHVRRTLNRLNKLAADDTNRTTEIVIQAPKSENSIRTIPLLPNIVQDLQAWQQAQLQDAQTAGTAYTASGFVVTNELGGYIEPDTFRGHYKRLLSAGGFRPFTFHALRHTFATRALEQGMDAKTLSVILGHYSVAFTLDTYAHVLDNHKRENMALMAGLFQEQVV